MNAQVEQLKFLYNQTSKHSNYQILPECLKPLFDHDDIQVKSRYEKERLTYILRHIDPRNKCILDIGGNSGYFSFELMEKGAKHIDYYEGNSTHAEFVKLATSLTKNAGRLNVFNQYYDFTENNLGHSDITLLLNVLHHVGDDYGNINLSINQAKDKMIDYINNLAVNTNMLILQLGFCWQGNIKQLLFEHGTKAEMIDFIKKGAKEKWKVEEVGIAETTSEGIIYAPVNEKNIIRNDAIGEFLNRPLFIMRSRK
jgi:2-polyprenyl-3-methyl-5-hydroxy-6-metoxy-1,4-benzoquinol methylase